MSYATADIYGTKGANFTCKIDAATILSAYLEVPNMPLLSLSISGDDREVLVPSLPQGQSWVRLDLVWAPGDEDATIDVGTVTSGTVHAAMGKGRVTVGDTPGYIELWGE